MKNSIKDIFTRILCAVAVAFTFWFIDTYCVNALQNLGALSNLTIDENGRFYNNLSSTSSTSIGYEVYKVGEDDLAYYNAFPTNLSSGNYTKGGYGGSLVQCGMSFAKNNYYSVSYYFLSDSLNYYYHPFYTQLSNSKTLAIGTSNSLSLPTFNYETVSNDIQRMLVDGLGYLSSYTVVFKAPSNGTCFLSAFSSNPTGPLDALGFVGYTYESLGTSAPTTDEIQNALSSSFNSISNKIDSSINSVNSNIDSMKDKQDETNNKLDEQHETSKGIWGSIKELVTGIPNWFSNLGESIGNFFKDLKDGIGGFFENMLNGIKELFYGKEETTCETYTNLFTEFSGYTGVLGTMTSSSLKPNENGYISQFWNNARTYYSKSINNLKPNTEYTFILEFDKDISNSFTINQPSNNFLTQFKLNGSTNSSWIKGNTPYHYYLTTNSDVSTQSYSFALPGNGSTVGVRFMILEGHIDENTFEYEYFKNSKEVCVTTGSSGGLFGILNNFISSIGNWFKELLSGILDGIKALFVPTDEQLYEIIEDSKELTENFGFVGESVSFFITIFTSLLGLVNANGCVEFPEFSVGQTSLFDSHKFWDKQLVCLNDNTILSSNITTIRTITSIVLVCMFINFAASKFFSILSKNDYGTSTTYDSDGSVSSYEWSRVNGDTTIYKNGR